MNWMRRNGAHVASGRRGANSLAVLALAGACALAPPGAVQAGDRALIHYLGYSQDLRYFAFEEFGIQDGSGFAYANVYVVDLATDSWVIGTPVRVQADTEDRGIVSIRQDAIGQASRLIAEFGIEVPVDVVALIGDGIPDTDARSLTFGAPGYGPGEVQETHLLALSTFPASAVSPCAEWFGIDPLGFDLSLTSGGAERVIHRDDALPRSRGCPLDYRIHGVVMPFGAPAEDAAVAIISVYPGGFEGPDRRFLAVPLGL